MVLSGAGISAESGLRTFRDSGGLWEGYDVNEVATPAAWHRNPELVLRFYNERRKAARAAQPNVAHLGLVELEKEYDVTIVTQNVDDLHERAGSSRVLHLHGELKKARSTADESLVYELESDELNLGDRCELGFQLRPHIVWFGEAVPLMEEAAELVADTDILLVIGTSLQVYPAAGLIEYARPGIEKYMIDPSTEPPRGDKSWRAIQEKATAGVPLLLRELLPPRGYNAVTAGGVLP